MKVRNKTYKGFILVPITIKAKDASSARAFARQAASWIHSSHEDGTGEFKTGRNKVQGIKLLRRGKPITKAKPLPL